MHRFRDNHNGQPVDIIAVKRGRAFLIDAKDCANGYFDISRIEQNQETAITLWDDCGNGDGWFAVKFTDKIYMCPLYKFQQRRCKRLTEDWFEEFAFEYSDWIRVFT